MPKTYWHKTLTRKCLRVCAVTHQPQNRFLCQPPTHCSDLSLATQATHFSGIFFLLIFKTRLPLRPKSSFFPPHSGLPFADQTRRPWPLTACGPPLLSLCGETPLVGSQGSVGHGLLRRPKKSTSSWCSVAIVSCTGGRGFHFVPIITEKKYIYINSRHIIKC